MKKKYVRKFIFKYLLYIYTNNNLKNKHIFKKKYYNILWVEQL